MNKANNKKHLVRHHNMFGPACEVESEATEYDFKIYCHKKHSLCIPDCTGCKYLGGSEMGKGVCCIWEEKYSEIAEEDHIVQHNEAYFEFQRVENPDIYKMMMEAIESNDFDLCEAWFGLD
ncbi:MAG: hypothetical protein IKL16_05260 [Clostridia bacterium]|nr:hypothetical protein [Clostridia bacterium]